MRRFLTYLAATWALFFVGCAGYHLGPSNGELAGSRSVQINPFINKTLEPRLSAYLINALRKNLQQDGTYLINTHDEGDIILSGVITSFVRNELSFQSSDVITVQDYEIRMTAQVTARERSTGRIIFDKPVVGRTTLRVGNDLTSAERQAIPMMTDDLAKKAAALLVDGTW
ncbi:LptE family protein [Pedosphaera parvula]|uniref:Lipoprotein n=1 Tax=Pedosphaera parvula (strain Ellin514) TaxID=320771 RepID=B9XBF5_PEDPL|nr:LptE family protein [Pedosphaera parvula]EEF62840.1 conserved hypothetical protein [Pedosphaera parvula Ellin514]